MNIPLHRFWFTFAISPGELGQHYSYAGLGYGCGVTAYSLEDALNVLRQELFRDDPLPEIEQVVEDVNVGALDPGHVLPNMRSPDERGIWFPII
jgi:hypothetical protein